MGFLSFLSPYPLSFGIKGLHVSLHLFALTALKFPFLSPHSRQSRFRSQARVAGPPNFVNLIYFYFSLSLTPSQELSPQWRSLIALPPGRPTPPLPPIDLGFSPSFPTHDLLFPPAILHFLFLRPPFHPTPGDPFSAVQDLVFSSFSVFSWVRFFSLPWLGRCAFSPFVLPPQDPSTFPSPSKPALSRGSD